MQLHFRKFGSGCPLIILHGLYGSGDNWYTIGKQLSKYFTIYLVDGRNHGSSPHDPVLDYDVMTMDLSDLFLTENIEKACLMGHSMGGKVSMKFALLYPRRIKKLVILDSALRSYAESPQTAVHQHIIESLIKLDIFNATNRADIETQLSNAIPQAAIRQFLLKNLKRRNNGQFYWGFNLLALMDNLPRLLEEIKTYGDKYTGPVMVISGENSGYINDQDVLDLKNVFPSLRFEKLPAGHWIHTEQPERLMELLLSFLPD
jgi:esterase